MSVHCGFFFYVSGRSGDCMLEDAGWTLNSVKSVTLTRARNTGLSKISPDKPGETRNSEDIKVDKEGHRRDAFHRPRLPEYQWVD